ncbi:hypothetical protein C8R44DRAFT_746247 [Mycena epipterygia]|nr:hypothetical protein C8R44DRAFT_746247 [Mycena epipterygia]
MTDSGSRRRGSLRSSRRVVTGADNRTSAELMSAAALKFMSLWEVARIRAERMRSGGRKKATRKLMTQEQSGQTSVMGAASGLCPTITELPPLAWNWVPNFMVTNTAGFDLPTIDPPLLEQLILLPSSNRLDSRISDIIELLFREHHLQCLRRPVLRIDLVHVRQLEYLLVHISQTIACLELRYGGRWGSFVGL